LAVRRLISPLFVRPLPGPSGVVSGTHCAIARGLIARARRNHQPSQPSRGGARDRFKSPSVIKKVRSV
jgi:hypothetical protein